MFLNQSENKVVYDSIKSDIHELYSLLNNRNDKSQELLDILDVLGQVYKNIDDSKHPEALVNRLVNFIRSTAIRGRLNFPKNQETLIINLSALGQKAGLNGNELGNTSDKSQFYNWNEQIPKH